MRNKRVSVSVRILPDVRFRLQVLAKLLHTSQAALIESLVTALWHESLHNWSGIDFADALDTARRRAVNNTGTSSLILLARELPRRPAPADI